jgi:NAD(P)-dependent dehydrogenase (short-subunit alcohol dehydrogenase family)
MSTNPRTPSAIVIGVGPEEGLGAAVARRFADGGFHVFLGGRTEAKIRGVAHAITADGGSAEAVVMDATSPEDVELLFERAFASRDAIAAPTVVVFNAGNNKPINFLELTPDQFEEFWRVGCFAGFLAGQAAARRLLPGGEGTILFTGASASLRGRPNFVQFAAAKAAQRGEGGLLEIDAIAEAYWQIHQQHRSAWTQELDLRPFKESL